MARGRVKVMLLSVFLMAAPSAAAEKPGIAVTEVKAVHGIEPSLAQVLNEVLLARLKDSGVFSSVIGGSDIAAMVDMEQQKAALGCDDTNCLAELGGALGVPYLMDSTISKVGGQFVVTLKILAVEEAKVLARKVAMVADEAGLIPSLRRSSQRRLRRCRKTLSRRRQRALRSQQRRLRRRRPPSRLRAQTSAYAGR